MLKIQQWIVCLVLLAVNATCFALPFNVYPAVSLPTFVQTGGSVAAYYVVTNNANKTLNNNFVKYLPPNVAQITTDATIGNLCGPTFNLAANGVPGDTCILELSVSGAVNANDPDPHHHLFVCLFGGVLCAGTNFPLSVIQAGLVTAIVITPAAPSIAAGQTQQFAATAVFSDGSSFDVSSLATWASSNTAVATVNSSGLATALTAGTTTISATFLGVTGSTVLTVNHFAIVSGNYTTTSAASFPILVQSSDGGVTWAYAVNSATTSVQPPNSSAFTVNGASCSGSLCLSVGNYTNGGATVEIYGFETLNAGTSYQTALSDVSGILPGDYQSGTLNAASCSGTNCSAAGSYANGTVAQLPLVMQTTNSGESYSPVVDSTSPILPGDFNSAGTLSNATCSSTICLASGNYSTVANQYPWLVQGVPPAAAWAYALTSTDITVVSVPDYGSAGTLNATACNGTNCVAAGSYTMTSSIGQAPLIAQATSTGTGWAYQVNSTNVPNDYDAVTGGNFNLTGAACATTACIAVGLYSGIAPGDTQNAPVIYQSAGGSATWTVVVSDDVGPALPLNLQSQLNSASCSGTLCVAAGTYLDSVTGFTFPLLMVSTNSGAAGTWTIAADPSSPTGLTSVTIGSTSCSGTFCTIAASYTTSTSTEPLVIETRNSGATFTYAVSASSPAEPADALEVFFTSAAVSSLINELTHKDFNHKKELKNMLTHY
jgi:hypothetical protein